MSVSLQVVVASRDLESRRKIAIILVNLGLDPICVSSVAQCRELLVKERIDLIFCDQAIAEWFFGVISVPYRPTDVEWMLIQAKRKQGQRGNTELERGITELLPARKAPSKNVA